MKTILVFAFAFAASVPGLASAAEIQEYATRLDVDGGGSGHATSTLVITGDPSETVVVPLSPGVGLNLRLTEATNGLRVEPPTQNAATLQVTLPPATGASRLAFAFDVPNVFDKAPAPLAGVKLTMPSDSRILHYAFVNSQVTVIKDFRVLVTLPLGSRFQAIREQLPKQTRSEAEPRVRLGGEDGAQNALLRLANLVQGDDTSMRLEVVPSRRSPLWLVAGFVLSALYLVKFRDLVSPGNEPAKTR
jgi:hypothetical protein